jgi:pimeloyl-ACP methyl ester carboxylesterase
VEYGAFASLGFIAVIPDYIGFGSASSILHPYYVEDLSASSVIDNLKAATELAGLKSVAFNKDLFLVGYSEGGYVTMATHKYLDQNPTPDFKLVASFPAAGGYDILRMQEYLFGLNKYSNPFYIAYVAYAYKTTFDWAEPLTDWFNEPYASAIPGLFTGQLTGSEINSSLTDSIPQLISKELLTTADSNPKYEYIVNAFAENSLTDWVPVTPMYMYHGDADTTIPYENSQAVYEQLLDNGASDEVVHLITLEGAGHGSGLVPFIEDVIPKIMSLDGD